VPEPLLFECEKCDYRCLVTWGEFEETILDHGDEGCLHSGSTTDELRVGVRVEPA